MQNLKEKFINDMLMAEQAELTNEQLKTLEINLRIWSRNISFHEECTEVSTQVDDNEYTVKLFISHKKLENLSDLSIEQYVRTVWRMLEYLNKNYKDVTTDDIKYYLAVYKTQNKVSSTTLSCIKRFLSAFFGWAAEEGLIRKNPVRAIKGIKPDPAKKEFLTDHEKELLRDNCKGLRELALVDFLLSTGIRVGELVSLNRDDVNFQNGTVTILGHKTRKFRTVFLSAKAAKHLKDYLDSRVDDNPALFVGVRKPYNRLGNCSFENILKQIAKRAGIQKHCTVHLFRKTLATTLHRNGCSLEYVAEILGHSSTNTTRQCYLSICQEDVQAAFRKYVA